jgi:hypothetical protein
MTNPMKGSIATLRDTLQLRRYYISPHSVNSSESAHFKPHQGWKSLPVIVTCSFGRLFGPAFARESQRCPPRAEQRWHSPVATFSIFRTTNIPSCPITFPNTQCFPSKNGAGAVVMKN